MEKAIRTPEKIHYFYFCLKENLHLQDLIVSLLIAPQELVLLDFHQTIVECNVISLDSLRRFAYEAQIPE